MNAKQKAKSTNEEYTYDNNPIRNQLIHSIGTVFPDELKSLFRIILILCVSTFKEPTDSSHIQSHRDYEHRAISEYKV